MRAENESRSGRVHRVWARIQVASGWRAAVMGMVSPLLVLGEAVAEPQDPELLGQAIERFSDASAGLSSDQLSPVQGYFGSDFDLGALDIEGLMGWSAGHGEAPSYSAFVLLMPFLNATSDLVRIAEDYALGGLLILQPDASRRLGSQHPGQVAGVLPAAALFARLAGMPERSAELIAALASVADAADPGTPAGAQLRVVAHLVRAGEAMDNGRLDTAGIELDGARALIEGRQRVAPEASAPDVWGGLELSAILATGDLLARQDLYRDVVRELEDSLASGRWESAGPLLEQKLCNGLLQLALTEPESLERGRQLVAKLLANEAHPIGRLVLNYFAAEFELIDASPAALHAAELNLREMRAAAGELGPPDTTLSFLRDLSAVVESRLAHASGEAGRIGEVTERLDQLWNARLADWAEMPIDGRSRGFFHLGEPRLVLNALIRGRLALDDGPQAARAAMEDVLRLHELGTTSRGRGWTATVEELQAEVVPPGGGVLFLLPGYRSTWVGALDADGVRWFEGGEAYLIDSARRDFVRRVQRDPAGFAPGQLEEELQGIRRSGKRLRELLAPEEAWAAVAAWDQLAVVELGVVGYLPYEALPMADGTTLGLQRPVHYLPALSTALALARRVPQEAELDFAFVVGNGLDSADDLGQPRLPLEASDVDNWASRGLRQRRREVLDGGQASVGAALALGGRARVMEILTHGRRDVRDSSGVCLVLAREPGREDGLLRAKDFSDATASELVVLASCRAGWGPQRRGDSAAGQLVGALIGAGARTVVLPRSAVPYEATKDLARAFHVELAAGRSPALALFEARRSIAARLEHPYYHSLMHVVGAADRPLFEPLAERRSTLRRNRAPALGLAVLAGLALVLVRSRTKRGSEA